MTSIAITGATGFVGRHILHYLLIHNHDVTVLTRSNNAHKLPKRVKIFETEDIFNEASSKLILALQRIEVIIHSAWYVEPTKYLTSPLNMDCLKGTLQLAQAFAEAGGRKFVGIGTCFEYDLNYGFLSVQTPLVPKTLYAACKVSAFQTLSHFLPVLGVEFLWCRLFYLYGEGEDSRRLVPYLKAKLRAGETAELTSGNQIRDFMNVSDAGEQIVKATLSSTQGAFNICSGLPITVKQLAEQIGDQFGRRDLLKFDARPANLLDPPCVVGVMIPSSEG
ncbi:NAD-dependent epimerase/dehydratase [Gloeomargarita lithophora Alchichica-D10]|uniref:NAD-dependent epimerase/dehydratase n=1 Tax=Gloeomargarita lithophora Alchichica-D10 TaxID=1188229 RepID=A0A1J0AGY2_9CYAN|nr:NAD(P)-dependent oxidoreductase [Gloeomargarita lithophora]APB35147.1 NAD-dependent epimerase/dehydratase [Gloeomargarita lithophora Alchichica-D10]